MTAALEGGEWSAVRPGRTLLPGKTRYPFYRRLGGPQGRSGRAEESRPHPDSIPDRPARSHSLYRLSYAPHPSQISIFNNSIVFIMCNCSGGYYCYSSLNFLREGTFENYTLPFMWTRLNKSKRETLLLLLLLLMGVHANKGARAQLVQALRYKPESCGFDSRWCHWCFSQT